MSAIEQNFWAHAFMPSAMATYRAEVAHCVKRMGNRSEHDQPMVLQREHGNLVPKFMAPEAIDLDNLLQYELIMFEGKTDAGAVWKHFFFPTSLRDCFIGDSPILTLYPDDDDVDNDFDPGAGTAAGTCASDPSVSTCDDCGSEVEEVMGCPDGAEICQECFDAGRH